MVLNNVLYYYLMKVHWINFTSFEEVLNILNIYFQLCSEKKIEKIKGTAPKAGMLI